MPDSIVIFGSGGHAKVVIDAVLARTPQRKIIILDDADDCASRSIFGNPVTGGRDVLEKLGDTPVAPAVGNNHARASLMKWLTQQGHSLEEVIHPGAILAQSAVIDRGAFVAAGAIIIADARIGSGAIVNTGASVDHDCMIGEAAHIAPGSHLCGNVRIGARTLVGVGSSIRPGIVVADDVELGAGSVVVRDIAEAGTFAGNPARRLS
jgi:sugar O-acyltransferase (sialic acid O-acetyltransferase NeuD family)